MTTPNKLHQSGCWRAYIKSDAFNADNQLYVMKEGDLIAKGNIVVSHIDPAIQPSPDSAFMCWSDMIEDDIVDMFKAIAKALDLYTDEPSQAYKQGLAEGEAKVLREWNDSLRG